MSGPWRQNTILVKRGNRALENFKSFITEEEDKDEPYKLLILSSHDPHDPNVTGPMVRKKASELGRLQNPSLAGDPDDILMSYK